MNKKSTPVQTSFKIGKDWEVKAEEIYDLKGLPVANPNYHIFIINDSIAHDKKFRYEIKGKDTFSGAQVSHTFALIKALLEQPDAVTNFERLKLTAAPDSRWSSKKEPHKHANSENCPMCNILKTAATDIIKRKDGKIVILGDWQKDHIGKDHVKAGLGSFFSNGVPWDEIIPHLQNVQIPVAGGVVEVTGSGGYDLVMPLEEAQKLKDAKEMPEKIKKLEGKGTIDVIGYETTDLLSKFKAKVLSIVIRPSKAEFLPDDVKDNSEILEAIKENKVYSVLSAWPGKGDVPPASQWAGKWVVVVPK